jgi:hypothetical protein
LDSHDQFDLWFLLLVVLMCFVLIESSEASLLYDYADKIKDEPVEYFYAFNQAGYVLFGIQGDEVSFWVPYYQFYLLPDTIGIHNHPCGIAEFSSKDLEFFSNSRLAEFWVVTNTTILSMRKDGSVLRRNWSEINHG